MIVHPMSVRGARMGCTSHVHVITTSGAAGSLYCLLDWGMHTSTGWTGQLDALQRLVLRNASLAGTLPASLAALSALTHLDLAANAFSGTLPQALSALSQLAHLGGYAVADPQLRQRV